MRRVLLVFAVVVVVACVLPDSYHAGTSYGRSDFQGRETDFDTAAVYFGVSWHPGEKARHKESLDATRRLEIATVTGHVQPMPVSKQDAADDAADEEHWPIPPPPGDRDEAINLVLYGVFLLLAAIAALFGAVAFVKWRKQKNGTSPSKEETTP